VIFNHPERKLYMGNYRWLMIFPLLFVFGCATTQVVPDAVELDVKFSWKGIKRCSGYSPEIKVSGIPKGTKYLRVELKDLDVPSWDHGGGKVAYKGSSIIPAGSLKSGYNGPCPPSGSHRYQFTVYAVDEKDTIIGVGKATEKFP
jgi:phosphatidylethanolamine-binding protein (PEBP) family uncharacterized protein